MAAAKQQLKARGQQALEAIHTPECRSVLFDYDQKWRDSPALWVRLDLDDPTHLYTTLEAFPAALRDALGSVDFGSLTNYLIQEICQYIVIIPIVQGRMLNKLIWPFYTLTILQTENLQEKPWVYFPHDLPETIREDLSLGIWDRPEILTANRLSRSVATLRQLTSQIAEFQDMPDLTEPGMERLQAYVSKELSETLSESLQAFFDSAAELCEWFATLPENERQRRDNLRTAIESLPEVYEHVRPGEGDGTFILELAEIVAYSHRLEEIYPTVERFRLLWIADILHNS